MIFLCIFCVIMNPKLVDIKIRVYINEGVKKMVVGG